MELPHHDVGVEDGPCPCHWMHCSDEAIRTDSPHCASKVLSMHRSLLKYVSQKLCELIVEAG